MASTKVPIELSSTPGIVDNSNATAITIDSSENVGIANTSPSSYSASANNLVVGSSGDTGITIVSSTVSNGQLKFADGTTGDATGRGIIDYNHASDHMALKTAATERLRIDSSGNVGIGTSNPQRLLSATKANTSQVHFGAVNTSGGYLTSTDSTQSILSGGGYWNGTNWIATAGESSAMHLVSGIVSFYTNSGLTASSSFNPTERMRIQSGGTVSIGTSNSNAAIFAGNPPSLYAYAEGVSNKAANFHYGSTDNYEAVEFGHARATGGNTAIVIGFRNAAGTSVGTISMTATNTAYNTSSDARLKDVTGEARGLEVINGLNPVSYNWKESGMADEGLLAQEVMEIVPNAVVENNKGYYFMDYSKLITPLIKAVQEQQTLIEQLQAEVALLKGE